jgi:hypothetical protein
MTMRWRSADQPLSLQLGQSTAYHFAHGTQLGRYLPLGHTSGSRFFFSSLGQKQLSQSCSN